MNYERIVQWAAGPSAILAGWLSNLLMTHVGAPGLNTVIRTVAGHPVAVTSSAVAHAIYSGIAFAVGAGATYAAHHKWLSNVAKWWESSGLAAVEQQFISTTGSQPPPTTPAEPPAQPSQADALRAQLQQAGITPQA